MICQLCSCQNQATQSQTASGKTLLKLVVIAADRETVSHPCHTLLVLDNLRYFVAVYAQFSAEDNMHHHSPTTPLGDQRHELSRYQPLAACSSQVATTLLWMLGTPAAVWDRVSCARPVAVQAGAGSMQPLL